MSSNPFNSFCFSFISFSILFFFSVFLVISSSNSFSSWILSAISSIPASIVVPASSISPSIFSCSSNSMSEFSSLANFVESEISLIISSVARLIISSVSASLF